MKVEIHCVGRLKEAYFRAADDEYQARLSHYATVKVGEHDSEPDLLAKLPVRRVLVLLDSRGTQVSSPEIAAFLDKERNHGGGRTAIFAIGGADGWSDAQRKQADALWAFGRVTLPHRLARVVLIEQLYRGFTILKGEPYHR